MNDLITSKLSRCLILLKECKTTAEAKSISDIAEAARVYAKRTGESIEVVNHAIEVKLRAERRLGEILNKTDKATGGDAQRARYRKGTESPPTLSDLGISKKVSSRAQQLTAIPEEVFERKIAEAREESREMTTSALLRDSHREAVADALSKHISMPTDKYRVLYADPPWSYGNTQPDYHTEQRDHYPVMSLKDICDLPVKEICENNAVLFLWVTSPILEESFEVIKAWGFEYKTSFVWDKVKHNMGHYNSVRHEFLLVCTRGSCMPDVKKLFDSVVTEERTTHSRKPAVFHEMIETIYPHGKRIELFSRDKKDGWDSYGFEA